MLAKAADRNLEQLSHQLTRLIVLRLVLILFLSGTTLFFQLRGDTSILGPSVWVLWWLIIASVFASFIFFLWKQVASSHHLSLIAVAQILWDIFFTTGLIYVTGSSESVFTPLYTINIAFGAIVLGRGFGHLVANLCLVFFLGLLMMEYRHWLPAMLEVDLTYGSSLDLPRFFSLMFTNMLLFNAVAYAVGYLVERLQVAQSRLLEESQRLLEMSAQAERNQQLASIGRLAAAIAHEIRNPLTSISGSIEMLQEESKLPTNQRLMGIVLRETQRLNALISDFLEFAKPSPPELQAVDLARLVDETLLLFNQQALAPSIRIEHRGKYRLFVDPAQIKQVFWNLLKNAVDATNESGEIRIHTDYDPATRLVVLEVHDSGVGIPAELHHRIFDPFFTTKRGGSGLGLATVAKIVAAHGGKIELVHKSLSHGATFRVSLKGEPA